MCSESPFICLISSLYFLLHVLIYSSKCYCAEYNDFPGEYARNSSKMVRVTWVLGEGVIPEMVSGKECPEPSWHRK